MSTSVERVASADVRPRLHELFEGHRLSPAQRRIARYLLDHADEAVFLTGGDLAGKVGVSQPSVTRFSVALGFAGYPDLRNELRARVRTNSQHVRPEDGGADVLGRALAQDVRALEALAAGHNTRQLHRVGRALVRSRPLAVLGVRVSRPIAEMFCYFARKVHPDVRLITDGSVAGDRLDQARRSGASWVLAFGLPRYPQELFEHMAWARRLGFKVALLTDDPFTPLAEHSDEVLSAAVGTELVFDSPTAPVALSMCLLQSVYDALPAKEQARLDEFDQQASERGLFLEG